MMRHVGGFGRFPLVRVDRCRASLMCGGEGLAAEGDLELGSVLDLVVVDLQAQRLEQTPGDVFGYGFEVARADGEHIEQPGVGTLQLSALVVLLAPTPRHCARTHRSQPRPAQRAPYR
jgi:hypothetical protein